MSEEHPKKTPGRSGPKRGGPAKEGEKVRVPFRRNRGPRKRVKDWTDQSGPESDVSSAGVESIVAKGDLSRMRTIMVQPQGAADNLRRGTVVAVRGLYADVDDGGGQSPFKTGVAGRIWPCTVRRVLRTRSIEDRSPVIVGDHVRFSVNERPGDSPQDGVVESVEPRKGVLRRRTGRKLHTIVVNVDQAVIVSSAGEPDHKPHLIDRYIVTMLYGGITPVICMNKIDLDVGGGHSPLKPGFGGAAESILERYRSIGYRTLCTSTLTGQGIDELREVLRDKASAVAGQSGVGKSSLLNAVQPGLALKVGNVIEQTQKGRHTTTTAQLLRLDFGGYVVDTPGIRTLDVSLVPRLELEAYFAEFVDRLRDCKFPDCTHTHEIGCAVKAALDRGEIHPDRYATYLGLFEETR